VSCFKRNRKVEDKGATATRELAPLKKSIYSEIDLHEILLGDDQRCRIESDSRSSCSRESSRHGLKAVVEA
jgi:hypothetical protein